MSAFDLSSGASGFVISVSEQGPAGPAGSGESTPVAANTTLGNNTNSTAVPLALAPGPARVNLGLGATPLGTAHQIYRTNAGATAIEWADEEGGAGINFDFGTYDIPENYSLDMGTF